MPQVNVGACINPIQTTDLWHQHRVQFATDAPAASQSKARPSRSGEYAFLHTLKQSQHAISDHLHQHFTIPAYNLVLLHAPTHTQLPMKLMRTHSGCSNPHLLARTCMSRYPMQGSYLNTPRAPPGLLISAWMKILISKHIHCWCLSEAISYYSTKLGNNKKISSLKDATIVAPNTNRCNVERQYMYKTTRCNKLNYTGHTSAY